MLFIVCFCLTVGTDSRDMENNHSILFYSLISFGLALLPLVCFSPLTIMFIVGFGCWCRVGISVLG